MPKPKSPERPPKRIPGAKVESASRKPRTAQQPPRSIPKHDELEQLTVVESTQLDDDVPSSRADPAGKRVYPSIICELLGICVREASEVRAAFKNRNRQKYKNIFDSYKDKLSECDYSIIKGALFYLYEFSRVKSIDKGTALWMIGIYEIPISHIISYTSKEVLKSIAKDHGLAYSNKKAEDLVESIRGVIDPSY